MVEKICKNCGRKFKPTKKYVNSLYCHGCRKYHKECEICKKEIFVQARTCSKKCAYELRKKSWQKTCGADHNFSRESTSRKKWEKRLLEEEGIINVFQREDVKEKCKQTHLNKLGVDHPSKSEKIKRKKENTFIRKYGVKHQSQIPGIHEKINKTMIKRYGKRRITNVKKISETKQSAEYRDKMEDRGLWIPLNELSNFDVYRYNVQQITKEYVNKYFDKKIFEENKNKNYKDKITIDHKYSIIKGFQDKISPEIIGCIVNLELLSFSENSSKQHKCSISLQKLLNDYNNFINENKTNTNNKI